MEEKKEGIVWDITGDLNPGTWFDLEGGGKVCLRVCNGDTLRELKKKTTKKRVEYKTGQRFQVEDTDDDAMSALIWDYCIVNWENFFDKNGVPIPCNKDTKNKLMGQSLVFSRFIGEKLDELMSVISAEKVEEAKN